MELTANDLVPRRRASPPETIPPDKRALRCHHRFLQRSIVPWRRAYRPRLQPGLPRRPEVPRHYALTAVTAKNSGPGLRLRAERATRRPERATENRPGHRCERQADPPRETRYRVPAAPARKDFLALAGSYPRRTRGKSLMPVKRRRHDLARKP